MIKLSFREPVYQEKTTKEGLKTVTCIIMYRPKGIECHGGPGFTEAVGLDNRYRKAVGTAVCDPHDTYDPELGKKLARSRAKDAAYSGFYNAIRESHEKFNDILTSLEKNVYAKSAMVRARNRNYRKKITSPATAVTPAPVEKPARVRARVKKSAPAEVEVKTKTVRKPRAKKVAETAK